MPQQSKKGRGYTINIKREGQAVSEHHLVWGKQGVLPAVWDTVKDDDSVEEADIGYNAGPRRKSRTVLDRIIRGGEHG